MKITLSLSLFCAILLGSTNFPALTGETLNGTSVTIPEDTSGKLTLVGMAYSKKSEGSLKSWFTPLYDKFILKRGIFDADYDINLYFVPMFSGLKKAAYEGTLKKLKSSNRKDLFDNILFYKGDLEPYKTDLKLKEKETPYLFLLNQKGEIVFKTEGKFTESKLEALEEAISEHE
ncbi:MAG: hypothetical protein AB8B53_08440 [Flavobacteriales bacterium]